MPRTTRHVAPAALTLALASCLVLASCSDDSSNSPPSNAGASGSGGAGAKSGSGGGGNGGSNGGSSGSGGQITADSRFETGDANGHADPPGAKAAGQARAGRITQQSWIRQPTDARQRVRIGDFMIVNDKVGFYIEDKGLSDGYARFGGEIMAVEKIADDGIPEGKSRFGETLMAIGVETVDPDSVTVMKDGSDGGEAVIRVTGPIKTIPFLEFLGPLFQFENEYQAAIDFALKPGAESLIIRLGVINPYEEDFVLDPIKEFHGFFHTSRNNLFTAENGFAGAKGKSNWVGFEGEDGTSFAWRKPNNVQIAFSLEVSGFNYYSGPGFTVPAKSKTTFDHAEVVVGGPGIDGLQEAIRRTDGETPWRTITGTLKDSANQPIADAWVHETSADGGYLTRVKTDNTGAFTIHAPSTESVTLTPTLRGYPDHPGVSVGATEGTTSLTMPAHGLIHVQAKDNDNSPLPVRVQVVPTDAPVDRPAEWGVTTENNSRLHQEFAVSGEATLVVPPGEHQVIVTRGYEYELVQQTVTVTSGQTTEVQATLEHSVDTTGVMCADFHIHSAFSADSSDPVLHKVKGALADGLDLPISSEHEWVIDFQPIIEQLGAAKWAYGAPSEELTTFTWGHFGVVPLEQKTDTLNFGAVDWIGKDPGDVFGVVRQLEEDPFFIVNHPNSTGFGGYFTAAGFNSTTGKGRDGFWSDNFDGIEVFNDSDFEKNRYESVKNWFSLLNFGKKVWAVGSSDSHSLRNSPIGYPRTCLYFGHDDFSLMTHKGIRDALRSGNITISGGLYMTVSGPDQSVPGSTLSGQSSATFTVTVQAPSWLDAKDLEVIVNGTTVQTVALEPATSTTSAKKWVNQITVDADPTKPESWVVFHANSDVDLSPLHPGRNPFAVSNPIYLVP